MPDGSSLELRQVDRQLASECPPIVLGRRPEIIRPLRQIKGLKRHVIEKKSRIEGRISKMDHFEIDRHHALATDQKVLRTPIAVYQRQPLPRAILDQPLEGARKVGVPGSGVAVVGVKP